MVYSAVMQACRLLLLVTICLVFGIILFSVKQKLARSRKIRRSGCQPARALPQKDPLFGLDLVYFQVFQSQKIRSRNAYFQELFSTFGHTFRSTPYGNPEVFTISPQNIQAIYSTDFESFGVGPLRNFIFEPLLGDGLMTTDGHFWKQSRAMVTPVFARAQFADLAAFNVHVSRLLNVLPKDGSLVDLQPVFDRLALDSSTEFLFGESAKTLAPDTTIEAQAFLDAYNYAQKGVGRRMMFPFWNVFTRDKKFWESCSVCHAFVDSVVSEAIRERSSSKGQGNQKYTIAYELAKKSDDRVAMRQHLLNIFLPTHDAIAIPLTNIFFNLARHPSVWAKLRQEVLAMGPTAITLKRLKKLKYVHFVISESLRLYPGVGTNERVALRDTVLPTGAGPSGSAPVFVGKGDRVTVSFYTLQRQKEIWGQDAEDFRPERWVTAKPKVWTNLPFGGGPRICPGQQLGMAQVAYTIVKIAQAFKLIVNQDPVEEYEDLYRVVTVSKNGAKVSLIPV